MCGALSSVFNPILYGLLNPNLRKGFAATLRVFCVSWYGDMLSRRTTSVCRLVDQFDTQQHDNNEREPIVRHRRYTIGNSATRVHKRHYRIRRSTRFGSIHTVEREQQKHNITRSPATFTKCTHGARLFGDSLGEVTSGMWSWRCWKTKCTSTGMTSRPVSDINDVVFSRNDTLASLPPSQEYNRKCYGTFYAFEHV